MLSALQLVAAEPGHVARRTERVGDRIELRAVGELVRAEQVHIFAQLVIYPRRPLIDAETSRARRDEIVAQSRPGRIRIKSQQPDARRIPQRLRNHILRGKLLSSHRMENAPSVIGVAEYLVCSRPAHFSEISLPHRRRRHGRKTCLLLTTPLPLVTDKNDSSVPTDSPAEDAAELIAAETRFVVRAIAARVALEAGPREEIARVEG